MPRDYYITSVPDDVVEKLEKLKSVGFDYTFIFRYAVKKLVEKPLNEVAVEMTKYMVAPLLGKFEKEAEPGV